MTSNLGSRVSLSLYCMVGSIFMLPLSSSLPSLLTPASSAPSLLSSPLLRSSSTSRLHFQRRHRSFRTRKPTATPEAHGLVRVSERNASQFYGSNAMFGVSHRMEYPGASSLIHPNLMMAVTLFHELRELTKLDSSEKQGTHCNELARVPTSKKQHQKLIKVLKD